MSLTINQSEISCYKCIAIMLRLNWFPNLHVSLNCDDPPRFDKSTQSCNQRGAETAVRLVTYDTAL